MHFKRQSPQKEATFTLTNKHVKGKDKHLQAAWCPRGYSRLSPTSVDVEEEEIWLKTEGIDKNKRNLKDPELCQRLKVNSSNQCQLTPSIPVWAKEDLLFYKSHQVYVHKHKNHPNNSWRRIDYVSVAALMQLSSEYDAYCQKAWSAEEQNNHPKYTNKCLTTNKWPSVSPDQATVTEVSLRPLEISFF